MDDTNKALIAHDLLDEDAVQAITEDNFHLELSESDSDEQTKEEKDSEGPIPINDRQLATNFY